MRRILSVLAAASLLTLSAAPVLGAGEEGKGSVAIMRHACTNAEVEDQADFDALQEPAQGDAVTALALTVLACPTIVLSENEDDRTDGVAGPAVDFDFEVKDSEGNTQTIADAEFIAAKLCETDIQRDANGDGESSRDVCLDISHYVFDNLAVGDVTVTETSPPNGWKFGSLLLTPQALQAEGNDQATGAEFDAEAATVTLHLSGDTDDQAMLHIYDFAASPAAETLPAQTSNSGIPLPIGAALAATLLGMGFVARRRLD